MVNTNLTLPNIASQTVERVTTFKNNLKELVCPIVTYFIFILQLQVST